MGFSLRYMVDGAAPSAAAAGWVNPVRFREAQFLIWCARAAVPESIRRRILEVAQAGLNWPLLLELAKSHEVEFLLARTLTELCPDLVPPADLDALRRRTEEAAAANRAGAAELLRLSRAFDEAGVFVLPFRGVSLAAMIYGDLTLCPSADPVALVRRDQLADAHQVLVSQGYSVRGGESDRTVDAGAYERPLVYLHANTSRQIELLWAVRHARMMFRIDRPEVWSWARPVSLDGRKTKGMAPEEALLVLCMHGAHQAWRHLSLVTEVAGLIRAGRLNWKRVLTTALEWKCYRVLLLGLALSHRVMDAPIPPQILNMIAVDSDVLSLAQRMPKSLLLQQREGLDDHGVGALLFTLQDDWNARWRYGIALCRSHDSVIQAPPDWFRWRRSLHWLARGVSPVHTLSRWLSPPAAIRHLFHR
ncbi:MAG: nucleotidyltransferase family protein [Nitrospira sp.]|nr:nucleotidyltransferase family protein [Nitrospira sp.]